MLRYVSGSYTGHERNTIYFHRLHATKPHIFLYIYKIYTIIQPWKNILWIKTYQYSYSFDGSLLTKGRAIKAMAFTDLGRCESFGVETGVFFGCS